jgi:hypothetical protein
VTIGILEVQAAAAVTVIDDAALAPTGIGPVGQALVPDPAEGSVELPVADQGHSPLAASSGKQSVPIWEIVR